MEGGGGGAGGSARYGDGRRRWRSKKRTVVPKKSWNEEARKERDSVPQLALGCLAVRLVSRQQLVM